MNSLPVHNMYILPALEVWKKILEDTTTILEVWKMSKPTPVITKTGA
jgi:hypothetical protein